MINDLELAWEEQEPRRRRGAPPSRQATQRRRKDRKRRRRSFGALFVSMLLLAALGGGVYYGVGKLQERFSAADYTTNPATVPVNVKINPGDTATEMGQELYAKKVVKSAKAFVNAYAAEPRATSIQPGTYRMTEEMPARTALLMLLDPDANRVVLKVVVPEGLISLDIYDRISKASGVPIEDFKEAAKDPVALGIPESWFKREDGKTAIKSVEGFLFPATYSFEPDLSAQEMLKQMVARFLEEAEDLKFVDAAQSQLHITPYEALIVASLAQSEARLSEDFAKVARVIYNRAYSGKFPCACLQVDAAANYWLRLQGKTGETSQKLTYAQLHDPNNPYNTHDVKGLPGGAISNPGREALQGAMTPVGASNVYYFVTVDKDGRMAYATTLAGHNANIAQACRNGVPLC